MEIVSVSIEVEVSSGETDDLLDTADILKGHPSLLLCCLSTQAGFECYWKACWRTHAETTLWDILVVSGIAQSTVCGTNDNSCRCAGASLAYGNDSCTCGRLD